MATVKKVNWKDKTEEVKKKLADHNPDNYLKAILQNYFLYGYRARRDIAEVLFDKWLEAKEKQPEAVAARQNIFLEIYGKYVQIIEDLGLIGLMFLNQNKVKYAFEIYMQSDNRDIVGFYKMAYQGLSDGQLIKILGMDRLYKYIDSNSHLTSQEKTNLKGLLKDTTKVERNNLKMLGKIYIEESTESGKSKLQRGGTIDVYNAVKHGMKVAYPTKLGEQLWTNVNEKTLNLMHQIVLDEATGQKLIAIGGFNEVNDKLVETIMYNIRLFSDQIRYICEIWLLTDKNPMLVIKILRMTVTQESLKTKKIGVNDKCLCGSDVKYKKCCKWFEYEYKDINFLALLDIL